MEGAEIDNQKDSLLLHLDLERFFYIQAIIYSITHSEFQRNNSVDLSVQRLVHLQSEIGKERAIEEFNLAFKNKYDIVPLSTQAITVNKSEPAHNVTWSRLRNVVFQKLQWEIPIDEVATPGSPVRVNKGTYSGQKGVLQSKTEKMVKVKLSTDKYVLINQSSIELDGLPEKISYPFNSLVGEPTSRLELNAFPFLNALCSQPLIFSGSYFPDTNCNKYYECKMRIESENMFHYAKTC